MLFKSTNIIYILLLFSTLLHGQTDTIADQVLPELAVTSNYKPDGVDKSVHSIRILNIEKYKTLGVQNVGELLKFQANLRIQQDNILGAGLSMQGISGENVKILIDGIPVIGRLNGNIDLNQLNLNNVERIEIVEGPLSVQYGTNALAGTINIIMKKIPGKTTEFLLNTQYEQVGHFNMNASAGWRGDNISVLVSGGRNYFSGWSVVDTSRFKEWKPRIQYFGNWNLATTLNGFRINYLGNHFDEYILNRGKPIAPYGENAFDDTYKTIRHTQGISAYRSFENGYHSNLQISYNYFQRIKNTYYRDLVNLTQILTENAGDQDTTVFHLFNARGTFSQAGDKKLRFESGFDINVEKGDGLRLKDISQNLGDYAVFTSAEWRIRERLILRPGLRAAFNTSYDAPIVPSMHMMWRMDSFWTLRASYGRGFRAPSLKELYFYFVDINHNIQGNENLQPEESNNFNAFINFKKILDKTVLKIETNIFFNDIKNLITLAQLRGGNTTFGYINIGALKTAGGQIFVEKVINRFSIGTGISYTFKDNYFNNQNFSAGTWEVRSNMIFKIPKANLDFNIWYKYAGKQPGFLLSEDGTVQPTYIAAYNMADMGVSKSFLNKKIQVSSGLKNAFNIKNIATQMPNNAHNSSNGASALATGRNFFVTCQIML